jgi:hypothetical protein
MAQVPSHVDTSAALGMIGTAPTPLTIVLVNGDTWRLEVFRIDKRRAEALVQALAAQQP